MSLKKSFIVLLLLVLTMSVAAAEEETRWIPVFLSGGSGKAGVESPAEVRVSESGTYTARIRFSSSSYDYLIVDRQTYTPVSTENGSLFEIPIPSVNGTLDIQADTTAMSQPHLIDYRLTFGEEKGVEDEPSEPEKLPSDPLPGMTCTGSMALKYARGFTVDYYENGLSLITVGEEERYLLVPENGSVPPDMPEDVTILRQPLDRIYIAASDAMDMFSACGAVSLLRFSGQKQSGWYIRDAAEAMEKGALIFAGKYSEPDYELLLSGGCDLVIENTMIYHVPKPAETMRSLGIPVLIETASYESTPQGRMEWVKLIGLITGHEQEAEAAFEKQLSAMGGYSSPSEKPEKVVFFYISKEGLACVRSSTDYIPQMIRMAGGEYVSFGSGESRSSTMNVQMETFYANAVDADYLVYNSTTGQVLETMEELISLNPLFGNFKAVKTGRVYCTEKSFYQSSMELGDFVTDLHDMLNGKEDGFAFLHILR